MANVSFEDLPFEEAFSEERTEPFSQSEIDARLRRIQVEEARLAGIRSRATVPLDDLQVDESHHQNGIRILVRDLTNSRSVARDQSCRWIVLRAVVDSVEAAEHHQVLAVTQSHRDIKFSVRIPGEHLDNGPRPSVWCELYYDPASDNQIFLNRSDEPVELSWTSKRPPTIPDITTLAINPGLHKALSPGTWQLTVRETIPVLDIRILEKRPYTLFPAQLLPPAPPNGKRSFSGGDRDDGDDVKNNHNNNNNNNYNDDDGNDDDTIGRSDKRPRIDATDRGGIGSGLVEIERNDGVIMFVRDEAHALAFPLSRRGGGGMEVSSANAQPLLDLKEGDTVLLPGGCEIDTYKITKRDGIASSSLSAVFTADHSDIPGNVVTVKVLKTKAPANARPADIERNVIRQADMWLREYQMQDDLAHDSIVKLYGGDARFLSLYMEHVKAKDLSSRPLWRDQAGFFSGSRIDAARILHDISGALHYLHSRRQVHNDIKPGNILFSRERGATLCDFGLSTPTSNTPTTGGTPYYIPPEFIGTKSRGPPSDVWALGIVMLYLLGRMPYPEARGNRRHPRKLYWMIADVNRGPHAGMAAGHGSGESAVTQMRLWLEEVAETRQQLNVHADRLERLVADMLAPNPNSRVTMGKVMKEFAGPYGPELLSVKKMPLLPGPSDPAITAVAVVPGVPAAANNVAGATAVEDTRQVRL